MESYDPAKAARVWQRVYGQQRPRLSRQQQQALTQCLRRSTANLTVYESLTTHPMYAAAFEHLAAQTREHIKMLRQILGTQPR